jgi:hypothetical protein
MILRHVIKVASGRLAARGFPPLTRLDKLLEVPVDNRGPVVRDDRRVEP